ncbi:MAG: transglutaminase-like domain-containing protein [Candidatus Shapirobacteria bacterium]|nr:transglutaminase-like domain-containing protein [Candidatus Shapirobacteria bacterium]MDD4382580.1 transglutaminase-like domain-containing protein [Candidatus Shapirobacteria bacterium]
MFLFFLISFLFFSVNPANAADEFKTQQKIIYQIDNQGNAVVNQEVQLINNFSEIYPTVYQLILSGPALENITGTDSQGNIIQKTDHQDDLNTIDIKFNNNNLGKDKITKFNLNYTIPKLATQKGNIWEVSVPENKNIKSNDTNEITVLVPNSFGNLSFSSSNPKNSVPLNNQTQIFFNNSNQKIFLIFGNYQLFDFHFKYFLENTTNQPQILEITIPPETDNQKIVYKEISPQPLNIRIDTDGNWLAQYKLTSNQELEINVSGQAKIIPNNISSSINEDNYLKEQNFWPINDPSIKQIVSSLKTVKDIYNYTVNTLNYDYNSINASERKGALNTLLSPNTSICTDFTDLFVTLARAKGIPAREVEGFAYTNNSKIKPINANADILHAWPQYYDQDKQSWVSVDPTWEKTTNGVDFFKDLDPNHFVFVFHGLDSEKPLPPGGYKNNHNVKTIEVEFATQELQANHENLKIISLNKKIYQPTIIKISNQNNNSISDLKISIPNLNWQQKIPILPPFSSIEITLPNYQFLKVLNPANRNIKIKVESLNTTSNQISISNPKYYLNLIIFIGLIITLLGLGGIILNSNKKHKK